MKEEAWSMPEGTLIWDRTQQLDQEDVLYPFALEELLCRQVGEGTAPFIHLWRHPRALVMGLRDSRLPRAAEAKQWLESDGYSVAVRNSGGAAVPLDLGVVNVSLILPKKQGQIDFRQDFETMYRLIKESLEAASQDVNKGEIVGSYCPGDYDLSIQGKKFCGIAQRRQAKAFVVQAFIVVTGQGSVKAELAQQFYRLAGEGAENGSFPQVAHDSMASLEELAGMTGVDSFIDSIKQTVRLRKQQTMAGRETGSAPELPTHEHIMDMVHSMKQRYGI
ncbi:lipoate--protein ligase family protein [Paenibacillus rigui]|uniref:Ligase n=1 Tax=Paenibacillus rigui TaxID=554312 RepID=A0A229UT20_9BACL|nr:lipoate--protein ligase family protein [Paenibacillus rigui]OXM86777.1 ligase [Paenibacillus rigui]